MLNRSEAPAIIKDISFHLPQIEKLKLNCGANVYFVKKENLPIVQMLTISNAGSKFDPNEKKGIATLTASMLDEGAGEYSALELNDAIESLGSMLSVSSDADSIYVSLLTLNENLDKSLEIFSKVITKPRFAEEDFNREKRKLLTRIIQAKDNPAYVASTVFEKIIFGENNPYGLPEMGNLHSVESITLQDLKIFYNSLLTPQNSNFIVVGNISQNEIEEKLNHYFENWHSTAPQIFEAIEVKKHSTKIYVVNKKDAAQTEINLGHISSNRNTPDFFAKQLMNLILGGQFTSRINMNLREEKGYTYGAHSAFYYNQSYGFFNVSCAVNTENTGDSVKEILKELNGILQNISEDELTFAKSSSIRKYPALFETYGQIARNLANKVIYSLPDDYFNSYLGKIKNINLNDVKEAAAKNIFPDSLTIVAVGNCEKIIPQLKELNLAEVIELDDEGKIINVQ